MSGCMDSFVLYKGYASRWDGIDWLKIVFAGSMDLNGFSARFKIGDYVFENNNLSADWIINLTDEQTGTVPLGINTGSLIVYDRDGSGRPFTTTIPVLVKDWVESPVIIKTYQASINVSLANQNVLVVNVEVPKADLTTISGYDPSKTQTLKNVNGSIMWVDD